MKKLLTFAFISSTIALTACGDDVTQVYEQVGVQSYESFDKLPNCSKGNQGEMAMSQKDGKLYYCVDSSWVQMVAESTSGENGSDGKDGVNGKDGKPGASCTANKVKNGVEIVCGGVVIDTLKNGEKGDKGATGATGEDGTSCTAKELKDKSGFELYCADKLVGTIKNGNDGATGTNGENCKMIPKENGVIEIKCGDETEEIYRAVCGDKSFDHKTKFCFEGETYEYCDGKTYDGTKKFCYEKELYDLCGGKSYDVENVFCSEGETYEYCDGYTYDGKKLFCYEKELYDLCGGKSYDVENEFCYKDKAYEKCNGEGYNGISLSCVDQKLVLLDERDSNKYNVVTIAYSTWMAQNLNHESENSFCYKDNNGKEDCSKYGRNYTWSDALNICPKGWHLPTSSEWDTFVANLEVDDEELGKYLKSTAGWGNDVALDTYGFTALPAGNYETGEVYYYDDDQSCFWSATENSSNDVSAYSRCLNIGDDTFNEYNSKKRFAYSVRCVMDEEY